MRRNDGARLTGTSWLTPKATSSKVATGKRKVGRTRKLTAKAVLATIADGRI